MTKTYDAKVWDLCMAFLEDEEGLTPTTREEWARKMAPQVQHLIEDLISEIPSEEQQFCPEISDGIKCRRDLNHCGTHISDDGLKSWD